MVNQIKELRVKIDGLAQLTKSLNPVQRPLAISIESIKKAGFTDMDEWFRVFNTTSIAFFDNENDFKVQSIHTPKELEKAYDSLILAKAWLGKVLGELGTESPYKSGYKEIKDIEPTTDTSKVKKYNINKSKEDSPEIWFEDLNHIEKVDWLRTEIEQCIDLLPFEIVQTTKLELFINNSYTHLSEAKFWLGFELQRIKEQLDK